MRKKKKGFMRTVRNILLILVVGFVILMFLPLDEEEQGADALAENTVPAVEQNQQTDGNSGSVEGSVAADVAYGFPEDALEEKQVNLNGDGSDVVTVMIYMNGSDLETEAEEASEDISEMLAARTNSQVNLLIETLGTKQWARTHGIASDHTQRYKAENGGLVLVDDSLGQLDCTAPETLADFIRWGAENYPANRYILILWNHGGGPVYGYGYDEHQPEDASLTIDEMQEAVRKSGIYFDFIGMDCCIMSSLELCCAMYDYCDYMILSEDFESGLGWSYTGWLDALARNPSIATTELGKIIVDDMISDNEDYDQDGSTLALIDESYMKILYRAWIDFAYANESALLGENYSMHVKGGGRAHPALRDRGLFDYDMSDYYITDIMAVAQNISSEEAKALSAAVNLAIAYFGCTSDEIGMTGLSVTLPYGDAEFYESLERIFLNVGIDREYVTWLEKFVSASGVDNYFDYDDWYENDWGGWDDYTDDFGLLDLIEWWLTDDDDWYDDSDWGWDSYDYFWDDGGYGYYD